MTSLPNFKNDPINIIPVFFEQNKVNDELVGPDTIKMVVSVYDSNGTSDFYLVKVLEDHENPYEAAKDAAAKAGYDPYVVYDEGSNDAFINFFADEEWNDAPVI